MNQSTYSIHGRAVVVRADSAEGAAILDEVFAPYRVEGEPEGPVLRLDVRRATGERPDFAVRVLGVAADGTRFSSRGEGVVDVDAGDLGWARIRPVDGTAEVHVEPRATARAWQPAYRLVEPVVVELLKSTGLYGLHAASVEVGGKILILCGSSGSGKSTTGLAMALRGAGFLGDDTCYLDGRTGGRPLTVRARWSDLHLTDLTLETLIPDEFRDRAHRRDGAEKWFLRVADLPLLRRVESGPAGWLVFPVFTEGSESSLVPLNPSEALPKVLKQSLVPSDTGSSTDQFDTLTGLCGSVPCYDLRLGNDLRRATDCLFEICSRSEDAA